MYNLFLSLFLLTPNIQVYFEKDTLSKKLAYFVGGAQSSLDICFHQYYEDEVIDSTLSAWNRGIKIRIISEYDYRDSSGIQRLIQANIPVIYENIGANTSEHRMHNKFIIRDYRDADTSNNITWIGSFNASGTWQADNAVVIKNYEISKIFETEFNQMWGDSSDTPNVAYARTGTNKYDQNTYHSTTVDGILIEAYFSPYNRIANLLLDYINYHVTNELNFLMFTFTNYYIYDAIGQLYSAGKIVYGVLEGQQPYNRDAYEYFQAHGVPVVWDNFNSGNGTYLHHKVLIIDDSIVFTGSYNFTLSADTFNDESIIIIHSPQIASLYKDEFITRYEETGNVYEILENEQWTLTRTSNQVIFLTRSDLINLFEQLNGFVFHANGRIIHNPYSTRGLVIYKKDKVWKKAIVTK